MVPLLPPSLISHCVDEDSEVQRDEKISGMSSELKSQLPSPLPETGTWSIDIFALLRKWTHCPWRMEMNVVVTFLLHLEHASFAASQKTHSFPYWGSAQMVLVMNELRLIQWTFSAVVWACVAGEGIHASAQMCCDVHNMENKTQALLDSPFSPSAVWQLTTRKSCSRRSQVRL